MWYKLRSPVVQEWANPCTEAKRLINMASGRQALDAVWRARALGHVGGDYGWG